MHLGAYTEIVHVVHIATPVGQYAEVLNPLSKAGKLGVGAVCDVGLRRSVKDSCIMWTNIEVEVGSVAFANLADSGRNDERYRRFRTTENSFEEDSVAQYFSVELRLFLWYPLSDNDPGIVQLWMRDDVGVQSVEIPELNRKESSI